MRMKQIKRLFIVLVSAVVFLTCETDPLTGKTTMALVSDRELFVAAFSQYDEFLKENIVVDETFTATNLTYRLTVATNQLTVAQNKQNQDEETKETINNLKYAIKNLEKAIAVAKVNDERDKVLAQAAMVKRLGDNIRDAAKRWYSYIGEPDYLKDYKWEYNLVFDSQINAWCMPGGKIVVYTGILPVTGNEDALATVMGHEVAHALLNHGRQRVSAAYLQQLGLAAASLTASAMGADNTTSSLLLTALGVGSTLFGTLPFSRENESEADHYGLILMAIAGFDPEASVPFWERMDELSGASIEFLSTHPSSKTRANDLKNYSIPEAKRKAARLHLTTLNKETILSAKKIAAEVNNR